MNQNTKKGINKKNIGGSVNIISAYDCLHIAPNRHIQQSYNPTYHCMIYTLSGIGEVVYSNGEHETLMPNSLFFSKFNNIKMLECTEGEWHFHIIWFQPIGFSLPLNQKIGVELPDEEEFMAEIVGLINTPKSSRFVSDFNIFYANCKLLMRIADHLALFNKRYPKRFESKAEEIIDYINANIHTDLKITDVANHFKYSEKQLRRILLYKTGLLPKKYIANIKLKRACELLTSSDYTIEYISVSLGYPYPTQFMKAFKEVYKMTPTEYRIQHNLNNPNG